MTGGYGSAGGMGGWSGPGAKSSVRNAAEEQQYKDLKRRLEAEEQEKKDLENARRVSVGQKPIKESVWVKVKKFLKRTMM